VPAKEQQRTSITYEAGLQESPKNTPYSHISPKPHPTQKHPINNLHKQKTQNKKGNKKI
jgi:hypothetical protein